jgi:hypothetical protein
MLKPEEEILKELIKLNPKFDPNATEYSLDPKTRMYLALRARRDARTRTSKKS